MGSIAKLAGGVACIALVLCAVVWAPVAAAEEPPPLLTEFPPNHAAGSEAERLANPRGIATDPSTGHVYVGELENARISEWTAWGEFVKAWGWGVLNGAAELQICTLATGCQKGIEGGGSGQLSKPSTLAIDSSGAIYVVDRENHRVQKFNPSGQFVLMFGGGVNQTTGGNLCTAASGDVCRAGTVGTATGQFAAWPVGADIAVDPSGTVYVSDLNRIQKFNSDGTLNSQIPTPIAGNGGALEFDPTTEKLLFAFANYGLKATRRVNIYKLDPATGAAAGVYEAPAPAAIAIDTAGNVYAADPGTGLTAKWVILKFDPAGSLVITAEQKFDAPTDGTALAGLATNTACGPPSDDLYAQHASGTLGYVRVFGPAPQNVVKCPPPENPPRIDDQYALSADSDSAVVQAKINPLFWNDTRYYVEYGTGPCSSGGCDKTRPVPPGTLLTSEVVNKSIATAAISLSGLEPATTYHFRFVAESSGGGPSFGPDPDGAGPEEATFELGLEDTFTTFPSPGPLNTSCFGNQAFRTGPSASLPDCRAYEMVSPVDKNNGDIAVGLSLFSFPTALEQSSIDGNSLSYSAATAFAGALSAPYTSQYLASRDPSAGWSTSSLNPPIVDRLFRPGVRIGATLDNPYKALSAGLSSGWLFQAADPPLDGCGVENFVNLYRRDNSSGGFEALTTAQPPTMTTQQFLVEFQGMSADGTHTIFRANDKLTSDAVVPVDEAHYQLYEHVSGPGCGELRLVSILPNDEPNPTSSSAGTPIESGSAKITEGRENLVADAISADGSRIFWSAAVSGAGGPLYVRIDGTETVEISSAPAVFQAASSDGSKAIFTQGADLYEYDVDAEVATFIASGFGNETKSVAGASDDAARVYFVSTASLDEEGSAGKPNLYLYEAGVGTKLVATLSLDDVSPNSPMTVNDKKPVKRTSHATPDGRYLAFMSTRSLTGYDNTDADTGLADAEVYRYDAVTGDLACVSCNPTGARPVGREIQGSNGFRMGVAAQLPTWTNELYAPRVLTADGRRLFFESFEGLVSRDTNGSQDVYQWEAAGSGDCDPGDPTFGPAANGCVDLISSGESTTDSEFADASPTGNDVFFRTQASLLGQDPGLIDLYDARVDGGFPPSPAPRAGCQGEACQTPAVPPGDLNPSSSSFRGPGDPVPQAKKKRRCPRNKRAVRRAGKTRCVKKHSHRHHKANSNRRAAK
jgi:hypothetical protein